MVTAQNKELQALLRDHYDGESFHRIRDALAANGTLTIRPLPTGLFSASLVSDFSKGTNYHAAWTRDNVHVAYAHFVNGQPETAVRTANALAAFYRTQKSRFDAVVRDPARRFSPMNRPHVRFDGDTCRELGQDWSHAQNDALGYFVWFYATLAVHREILPKDWDVGLLARFVRYFRAIEFWSDEESGHWEEAEKISASSIGAVVAGLRQLRELCRSVADADQLRTGAPIPESLRHQIDDSLLRDEIDDLVTAGETALSRILPAECVQPDPKKARAYDAALLFLIYPLSVVDEAMAELIVNRTEQKLRGPVGVKRYLGDSFYCTDYESQMQRRNDDPTRNFSQDMASRDELLRASEEAQWCLFDPIISLYYGKLYQKKRSAEALKKQTEYLNRSLTQVTAADPPRCEAYRCPELYYYEQGRLQTSKSTPLLWTQANLWTALEAMQRSLENRS